MKSDESSDGICLSHRKSFPICILFSRLCIGDVQSRYQSLQKSNFYSLPFDYSKRIPPETPTVVNLNFDIAEFVNIDDRRNVSWYLGPDHVT